MKKLFIMFAVLGFLIAARAYAIPYGFYNITNNNAIDAAIGEAQLWVDVLEYDGRARFDFYNDGPAASSITDVYFEDDGILDSIDGFIDAYMGDGDPGVNFSEGADPGHLPGFNPAFFTDFTAQSNSPPPQAGVNPGESLGILFDLIEDRIFTDVLAAIDRGALRIGIHVQGFASNGSESFVNNGPGIKPVPEPATMLLLGSGLIGFAVVGRRKFFKK